MTTVKAGHGLKYGFGGEFSKTYHCIGKYKWVDSAGAFLKKRNWHSKQFWWVLINLINIGVLQVGKRLFESL